MSEPLPCLRRTDPSAALIPHPGQRKLDYVPAEQARAIVAGHKAAGQTNHVYVSYSGVEGEGFMAWFDMLHLGAALTQSLASRYDAGTNTISGALASDINSDTVRYIKDRTQDHAAVLRRRKICCAWWSKSRAQICISRWARRRASASTVA